MKVLGFDAILEPTTSSLLQMFKKLSEVKKLVEIKGFEAFIDKAMKKC